LARLKEGVEKGLVMARKDWVNIKTQLNLSSQGKLAKVVRCLLKYKSEARDKPEMGSEGN